MMTENSSLLQPRAKQTNNRLFCFNLTTGETRRSKLEGLFKDDDEAKRTVPVKICACFENLSQSVESDFFRHDEGENSVDSQTEAAVVTVSQ